MRVHLISEHENEMEFLEDVLNILNGVSGSLKFVSGIGYELREEKSVIHISQPPSTQKYSANRATSLDEETVVNQNSHSLWEFETELDENEQEKIIPNFHKMPKTKKTWDDFKSFVEAYRAGLDENDSDSWERMPLPEESEMADWESLFNFCRIYRKQYDVGNDEHVMLLTPVYNENNWFAGSDKHSRNHFVHTADWSFFLGEGIDARYPVAYEIAITILHKLVSEKHNYQLRHLVHMKPKGCVSDFCADKTEIMLKMRTADICPSCIVKLDESGIEKAIVKHVLQVLDNIRSAMTFRSRSAYFQTPSRLEVRGYMSKLFLTDLGNLEVRLTPRQRAIYMLYLNHPEGIGMTEVPDHRDELEKYYGRFANVSDPAIINMALENLLDILSGTLSTELSRIRAAFRKAAGEEMAKQYIIDGDSGRSKKVLLNRELVRQAS
jgi:hypothetical protein